MCSWQCSRYKNVIHVWQSKIIRYNGVEENCVSSNIINSNRFVFYVTRIYVLYTIQCKNKYWRDCMKKITHNMCSRMFFVHVIISFCLSYIRLCTVCIYSARSQHQAKITHHQFSLLLLCFVFAVWLLLWHIIYTCDSYHLNIYAFPPKNKNKWITHKRKANKKPESEDFLFFE